MIQLRYNISIGLFLNYKATDPEMIQAQKDLAEMSNLSDRVISNDKDLFDELAVRSRENYVKSLN